MEKGGSKGPTTPPPQKTQTVKGLAGIRPQRRTLVGASPLAAIPTRNITNSVEQVSQEQVTPEAKIFFHLSSEDYERLLTAAARRMNGSALMRYIDQFESPELKEAIRTRESQVVLAGDPNSQLQHGGIPVDIFMLQFRGEEFDFDRLDNNTLQEMVRQLALFDEADMDSVLKHEKLHTQIYDLEQQVSSLSKVSRLKLFVAIGVALVVGGLTGAYVSSSSSNQSDKADTTEVSKPENPSE